jgi:hypothetical protein
MDTQRLSLVIEQLKSLLSELEEIKRDTPRAETWHESDIKSTCISRGWSVSQGVTVSTSSEE